MRKVIALALVSLTGCANFCDTIFRARNVCRDQNAAAGVVAAPMVVSAPVMSACSCAGGHVIASSEPYSTEVFSPSDCACSGPVVMAAPTVMAPAGVSYGSVVEQPPVVMGAPAPYASAVQPIAESKGHPMLRPFQWLKEHHQSKQQ